MFAELAAAFSTPESYVQLLILAFMEIILGIDNIVFISITSDRLPVKQQHIGRRLGLAAAMVTRICLLFTLSWIMHLNNVLFNLGPIEVTGKGIILFVGGIYLIYKGISETREMLLLTEEREAHGHPDHKPKPPLGLGRAVATIAAMDIVFSLDSVITAVGMVDHVIIAAIAIVIAIIFMMACADVVSDFINKNPEIKQARPVLHHGDRYPAHRRVLRHRGDRRHGDQVVRVLRHVLLADRHRAADALQPQPAEDARRDRRAQGGPGPPATPRRTPRSRSAWPAVAESERLRNQE